MAPFKTVEVHLRFHMAVGKDVKLDLLTRMLKKENVVPAVLGQLQYTATYPEIQLIELAPPRQGAV